MFSIALLLLVAAVTPRVEDPWPESIGFGFPFTMAGAVAVLAGVLFSDAPQMRRDRAVNKGGVYGFRAGALLYGISLANQVLFGW